MLLEPKSMAGALLLLIPFNDTLISLNNSCYDHHFYGNYRDGQTSYSVLQLPSSCLTAVDSYRPIFPLTFQKKIEGDDSRRMVWIEEASVEDNLKNENQSKQIILNTLSEYLATQSQESNPFQEVMGIQNTQSNLPSQTFNILYSLNNAMLLSLPPDMAQIVDTLLPMYWKSTLLPTTAVKQYPVLPSTLKHVENVLYGLKFDPVIASIVNNMSIPQMMNDVKFLTGEDKRSGIISRHSFSDGALIAGKWLKDRFEDTGAKCELIKFLEGFAPNVVCRYAAVEQTERRVLFAGHYDSRGSFGSTRAPGGDDDGSGITALLAIARTIGRKGLRFHSNVELVAFAGEEQGLFGSRAYARELKEAGVNLDLMIQADMLAYRAPQEPMQLGIPEIGAREVLQLIANISSIYSPKLQIGYTSACCSDHQSFHQLGFPAGSVFERAGPIADPMYHNSGDVSDRVGYDFEQLHEIAKVEFAALLHTAGFDIPLKPAV